MLCNPAGPIRQPVIEDQEHSTVFNSFEVALLFSRARARRICGIFSNFRYYPHNVSFALGESAVSDEVDSKPIGWAEVKTFLLIAVFAIAVVLLAYLARFHDGFSDSQADWGQFGDYIGGVLNPIFAFLSFIILVMALVFQSRELHASISELKESTKALNEQRAVLEKQTFENTYFQMLRRVSEIVDATKAVNTNKLGQDAFKHFADGLAHKSRNQNHDEKSVRNVYGSVVKSESASLGHYFRTLYHVFTFVDRSTLSDSDKIIYANIARAQLSDYELVVLFYNCTIGEGEEGFKPLIEKYGLLKHLRPNLLGDPRLKNELRLFEPTAFMSANERREYWEMH